VVWTRRASWIVSQKPLLCPGRLRLTMAAHRPGTPLCGAFRQVLHTCLADRTPCHALSRIRDEHWRQMKRLDWQLLPTVKKSSASDSQTGVSHAVQGQPLTHQAAARLCEEKRLQPPS